MADSKKEKTQKIKPDLKRQKRRGDKSKYGKDK
jgi:hypothetical protein